MARSQRDTVTIAKHFKVSKANPGRHEIRLDRQGAIETGRSGGPVAQKKVIVGRLESDDAVARIEGPGAFEACNRFAPASLPAIDAANVIVDVGVIRRSRRGD